MSTPRGMAVGIIAALHVAGLFALGGWLIVAGAS